jgi:hypothetical protein
LSGTLRITDLACDTGAEFDEISAQVGDCRLWYRVTRGYATASPDAFLAVGLMAAMASNQTLELPAPITCSPFLLGNLDKLQEIFHCWNPALRRVAVRASAGAPPASRRGSASFFSGGVDGLYTFLQHEADISHLIQLHGYEYRRENRALGNEAEARNRAFAEARGRTLVIVETNMRELFEAHNVHIYTYHGAALASVAHLLGFQKMRVPASCTWATMTPWGSHPTTDPLWSTEAVSLVHDGCEARRDQKMQRIGEDSASLRLLRVCPRNSVYNCGVCEKCLRTRVILRLLGLASPNFEPLTDLRPIRRIRFDHPWKRDEWDGNLRLAIEKGDHQAVRAISAVLANYDVRHALRSFDRAYLGGRLRRWRVRFSGDAGKTFPIEPTPPEP